MSMVVGEGTTPGDALLSIGGPLRRADVSPDRRALFQIGGRDADTFYRDRWSYDKVVRSTHGSVYRHAVTAVSMTLPLARPAELAAAAGLARSGPPREEVGLW
jgi:hypothetical protein